MLALGSVHRETFWKALLEILNMPESLGVSCRGWGSGRRERNREGGKGRGREGGKEREQAKTERRKGGGNEQTLYPIVPKLSDLPQNSKSTT